MIRPGLDRDDLLAFADMIRFDIARFGWGSVIEAMSGALIPGGHGAAHAMAR